MRVLIIDDHEIVRRGLKEVFADEFPGLNASEAVTYLPPAMARFAATTTSSEERPLFK